ncbi:hypothetical protein KIW84_023617 [Lathyrus oleraceus]|uniref:Reverse transcriptase zinc-binding domain-containing protein n=1 Tax=Pisum sativum TaxID=3888 RepID=A0A9D4YFY0_PEA|nr:hypothetical protein KIW84_023617 [Pisum sativum]
MSQAKGKDGLSLRGIKDFNTSLLGKQLWRLMQVMVPFFKGIRWRIGNGERVKIWEDNWIPTVLGFKTIGPNRGLDFANKVCILIDSDLGRWNLEALQANFDDSEAIHIASFPLFDRLLDDKLIWHFEKDGEYSIKMSYHLLRDINSRSKPDPSTRLDPAVWKSFWKTLINERVKNFIWRLSKVILPTKYNLSKKGIRNKVVFKKECPDPRAVSHEIWDTIEEFNKVTMSGLQKEPVTLNVLPATKSWTMQTDVGYFSENMVSLGCVIKDPNDNIFLVASNRFSSHVDVSTTKVPAIR